MITPNDYTDENRECYECGSWVSVDEYQVSQARGYEEPRCDNCMGAGEVRAEVRADFSVERTIEMLAGRAGLV